MAPGLARPAESASRLSDTIDSYEHHLLKLLVGNPDLWLAAGGNDPRRLTSSALRRIYETGCRLVDVGVLPDYDRLNLKLDDPALKSMLVDLDTLGPRQAASCPNRRHS